ncbi:MAG: methyltransferase domain-containing protein [Candidatus Pacearchaeota archaeon]|nr:methyltransferase domain-containing protein [Candidatus Pacearchaeota archaeon]
MEKIQFYSEKTRKFYQLFPTSTIPTLKISGVPMHRFTNMDPLKDTLLKIKAAKPIGIVLDTCCGLGYTAIFAAKKPEVKKVYTFEKDENVIKIAKLNDASKDLFENKKIILEIGDVTKKIRKFKDGFFDSVVHDPPTFKLAPELYSENFYREIIRVLKAGGRLWHYCPNPQKLKYGERFRKKLERKLKKYFYVSFDEFSSGFVCRNSKKKNFHSLL